MTYAISLLFLHILSFLHICNTNSSNFTTCETLKKERNWCNIKMKFGKEFASQMVPEWKEAYLDYAFLKTQLKELQMFKQKNQLPTARANSLKRSMTLYRAFSGLTHLARHAPTHHHHHHHHTENHDIENQVILVNSTRRDGTEGSETMFLNAADEGGEYELMYFKRLDDEFNKVLKFYRSKVNIVMEEAGELNKQMDALIAFRVKVENPNGWANVTVEETTRLASEVAASTAALSLNSPSLARDSSSRRVEHMNVIDEENSVTMRRLANESNDGSDEEDGQEMKPVTSTPSSNIESDNEKSKAKSKRPAHLDVLNQVKFNTNVDTPRSTIKGVLKLPIQTDLKFSKDNLNKAEEQLKKAFVEFYNKLKLLKSYSFLNLMAISKIMKKYDKIASRSASKAYMKMVDNSYLGASEEVNRLMERVEATFIKHFANSNRSKGMNILRPRDKRERHRVTFSTGFLVGCTVSLLLALILVIRARNILEQNGTEIYMDTMFPLYSLFGFIVLHMLTYAANIYYWRKYRVNYAFILGFKQGTELGYKEVLLVSFSISVLALASVLANLDMEMNPQTRDYQALTELLPLGLLVLLIAILICPLNIIYRSSRFFLLTTLCHCVLAPLYKVTLPDFLLADQFTSQVQALRDLEFYICYYGWGDYRHRENSCSSSHVFNTFSFILGAIPFWWRTLQCLRRWIEEKDNVQGYNGIKYFMTIVAVCTRTAYTLNGAVGWLIAAWISSVIAAILHVYWDIILDWGLLQRNSKNKWLRDKLLVPHKSIYFVAIVSDVILRLAWVQSVLNITFGSLHTQTMLTIMACLEIIRRGVWNFFRVENEHLNNIGKYRAFKSVPLPFNYDEDDDKEN